MKKIPFNQDKKNCVVQHVQMLASGLTMAHTGIGLSFVFDNCTLSRATVSYQVVQSPNMRREERRESTWIMSHLLGVVQGKSTFWGSFNQPAFSLNSRAKTVVSPLKALGYERRGKTKVMPGPTGPTQVRQSSSTRLAFCFVVWGGEREREGER